MTRPNSETQAIEDLMNQLGDGKIVVDGAATDSSQTPRNISQLLAKIPVLLTLEVGSTQLSIADVLNLQSGSIVELDTVAGQPLLMKVNGTVIGRAEVVVTGETHGLRVVETYALTLENLHK